MLVLQIAAGVILAAVVLFIAAVVISVHLDEQNKRWERGQF